tara:strand:+ start:147 stop:1499 length:1353 start_codon:yes stop_codon:yes gene_type:complete
MPEFINRKLPYIFIFVGLIYSIINSIVHTNKYDKYTISNKGKEFHTIIKTDIEQFWDDAHNFKLDLENGKGFLKSGKENESSILYPRFIAFYYILINKDLKDSSGKYILDNSKFGILIIQSIVFYLILFLFFRKINTIFEKRISIIIIAFLSLEPSIIQYHGSYRTESLYFSFLLIIIYFLLDSKKNIFHNFLFGFVIGLSMLQRNVSIYLILPVIIYLIFIFRQNFLKPVTSCLLGYLIVFFFIGYSNFIRAGVFYVMPWGIKDAPYTYLAHKLNNESEKIKYLKKEKWIEENNIDTSSEIDRRKIANYQHNYFMESLKSNFIGFIKIHTWKSLQALVINPFHIYNSYSVDKSVEEYWKKWHYQLYYKIPYSLLIYFFCFLGFIQMIKKNNYQRNLSLMISLITLFYVAIHGWVGVSRYMEPILFFLSIFFGVGFNYFIQYMKKTKKLS